MAPCCRRFRSIQAPLSRCRFRSHEVPKPILLLAGLLVASIGAGCAAHDAVSARLSRDFLRSKRKTGFKAKLWGRRDSVVISVPPEYIEGLLARMERGAPEVPAAATNSSPVPAAPAP